MNSRLSAIFTSIALVISIVPPTVASAAPTPGSLIKISCPSGVGVDHPCKAVYFYGHDQRRHAFPNERVYFTWYNDFSAVQTVTPSFLASITLGSNVTYRPGSKMVKFQTLDKVYAIGLGGVLRWVKTENLASSFYGADWNRKIDDISDAFFSDYRFGDDINLVSDYSREAELAAATIIDHNLPSTSRSETIVTSRGSFSAEIITLHRSRFEMITDTGNTSDCADDCTTKTLADYATENAATIGIHGTYFCPPDYADCATKTNRFLGPVFNSAEDTMINASDLRIHEGPMIASATDGRYFFFHRTSEFGNSVAAFESTNGVTLSAALANYPSLVENGTIVVESEARLAETQPAVKAVRGGIGFNDRFVYLVIVRNATVIDLAYVMQTLGSKYALNLDGGGSAALWYEGSYKFGPGRTLPNAILFKQK